MFNLRKSLKEKRILMEQKKIFNDFSDVEFVDFNFITGFNLPVFFYYGYDYNLPGDILSVISPKLLTFCTERLSIDAMKKLQTNIPYFKEMCEKIRDAAFFSKEEWNTEIDKSVKIIANFGKEKIKPNLSPEQPSM